MLYIIIAIFIIMLIFAMLDDDVDPRIAKEVERIMNERNDNS